VAIYQGDDSRRLVSETLVKVLTHLIDLEPGEAPSATRVELRMLRSRLCRLYKIEDPQSIANAVALVQHLAEEDGDPQDY